MPARLVSLSGYPHIPLTGVLTVVGRHRHCNARVDSSRVSRRHCCLALDGGELVVRDLSSTNGTFINGLRVADGLLRPGEELAIAHLLYRLEIDGAGDGARPPDPAEAPRPAEPPPGPNTSSRETLPEAEFLGE